MRSWPLSRHPSARAAPPRARNTTSNLFIMKALLWFLKGPLALKSRAPGQSVPDRGVGRQTQLLVEFSPAGLVVFHDSPGESGDQPGLSARDDDDAVSVRYHHVARPDQHSADRDRPVDRPDLVPAGPDAAASLAQIERALLHGDLIRR